MKFIFNFRRATAMGAALVIGTLGLLGVSACRPAAPVRTAAASAPDGGDAQRLVMLIDYVGGDYRRAVVDGKIALPEEYDEQVRFVTDARAVATRLGAREGEPLLAGIDRLGGLVNEHADADRVAAAAHEAREQAVDRFHLATIPTERPSLERAQAMYTRNCAVCHGAAGDGNTETAHRLNPAPAQFSDPARLREMSPYRVYNALTFGVKGTAMPSFEALSAAERWDLAFFVFRLGHEGQKAEPAPPLAIAQLATRSNRDLVDLLREEGVAHPEAALVQLRRQAAFEEPPADAGVERTRQLLARSRASFAKGQVAEADRQALDAYLLGFEPLEPRLRARDPERTDAVERGFRDLRVAMSGGRASAVNEAAERLDALLVGEGDSTTRPVVPMLASLLIYVREGIEAALLIGALLAGLRRMDRKDATRWVHLGWLCALPAGLLTWWLSEKALAFGAAQRELMEAVLALLAAAVLFSMSFWMISKAEARRWTGYLRRGLQEGLDRKNLGLLFGVAFLAVYREAAETVLFTQALLLEAGAAHRSQVWMGAGIGLVCVAAIALVLSRTVDRLPVATFFGVSSLLLCGLAIAFAGSGIYELVAAGYLHPRPVAFPEIPWMGIHPDLTALLVQLTIVTIIAVAALSTFTRRPSLESGGIRPPQTPQSHPE